MKGFWKRDVKNIKICMGSSCFARGDNICTHGPNINIDGVQYYGVDKKKLMELLNE